MATQRATCWSLTINNPTEQDEECINLARQKGWHVVGQKERGENGTDHYQLMVKTPQVRFSALKKSFPRAHIEVARDPIALAKYVQKEETRVGELVKNDSMYPTMSKVWSLLAVYVDDNGGGNGEYLNWDEAKFLRVWDAFIGHTIHNGLYVEHIGANPQNRSIVKLYGSQIVSRELNRMRSESTVPSLEDEHNNASEEDDEACPTSPVSSSSDADVSFTAAPRPRP